VKAAMLRPSGKILWGGTMAMMVRSDVRMHWVTGSHLETGMSRTEGKRMSVTSRRGGVIATTVTMGAFTLIATTHALAASPEVVMHSSFEEDADQESCQLNIATENGRNVTISTSYLDDTWQIWISPTVKASTMEPYFDGDHFDDLDFELSVFQVHSAERDFFVHDFIWFAKRRSMLQDDRTLHLITGGAHNVEAFVRNLDTGTIGATNLFEVTGLEEGVPAFQQCVSRQMGAAPSSTSAEARRVDARLMFDQSFERWVEYYALADHCSIDNYKASLVERYIDRAGDAFFPGLMNTFKRNRYTERLEKNASMGKLSGDSAGRCWDA